MAYSTTPSSSATLTLNLSGFTSSDPSVNTRMSLHNIDHTTGCKKTTGLKELKELIIVMLVLLFLMKIVMMALLLQEHIYILKILTQQQREQESLLSM